MHASIHSARALVTRPFTCSACGYVATAQIITAGEGASTDLNSAGVGAQRAIRDAHRNADMAVASATCPSCGHRDKRPLQR